MELWKHKESLSDSQELMDLGVKGAKDAFVSSSSVPWEMLLVPVARSPHHQPPQDMVTA